MSSSASTSRPAWTQGLRLPEGVVPRRYDVALAPDLAAFTFQGSARIRLTVAAAAAGDIVLHSFELTYPDREGSAEGRPDVSLHAVDAACPEAEGALVQWATAVQLDAESQRARIAFADPIQPGEYVLRLRFDGILNDQLAGFYRSAYVSARDGKPKFMAVTQFEATDCRRALPCWDEPAIKAVFAVTLLVDPTQVAVSNMPVQRATTILASAEEQKRDPLCRGLVVPRGWVRYNYTDSPIMSSYLLAFVVGEFDYLSAFSEPTPGVEGSGRVELRIYTPTGETHKGEFALDVALRCLTLYEKFFNLPYPLPKLDLLAVPDFASGAMENWGAITYRDTMLLIDPEQSSALIKQRCAKTIAHEISHMWFGNSVTMEWWNSLWLNEGFARYCESWAVDALFPDWCVMDQFINDVYGKAQAMDGLESSHAVEVHVSTPEEINEVFDALSYDKGASLIGMLIETIGAEAFQRGLQIYLKQHAFGNTTSRDLFAAFSQASREHAARSGGMGVDTEALMSNWITRIGYPVLEVTEARSAPAGKASRSFQVAQSRFLQSGSPAAGTSSSSSSSEDATVWSVPMAIGSYSPNTAGTLAVAHRVLTSASGVVEVDSPAVAAGEQPVYSFNHASTGFYRVLYSPPLFQSLSALVAKQILPPLDRLSLLRDCYALSACGQGYTVSDLLDLLLLFEHESNFVIIQSLSTVLGELCALHQDQPYFLQLQKLVTRIFARRWAQLGWGAAPGTPAQPEHHLTFLERSLLLQQMGSNGSGDVAAAIQARAFELLEAFVKDPVGRAIQPDLRAPVYALAIKARGQAARDLLIRLYVSPSVSNEERTRILSSLGTTCAAASAEQNGGEIKQLLVWAFGGAVRTGDLIYILASIGQDSALARRLCWAHMQSLWGELLSRFAGAMFVLGRIFPSVLGEMQSARELAEFESWFRTHPVAGAERSVLQCGETVRTKIARVQREAPLMQEWMQKNATRLQ